MQGAKAGEAAALPEVERLLAAFKVDAAMQPPEGLETRLLARLQTPSGARRGAFSMAGTHGWAPSALAASLICVFAGGWMVAHETSKSIEQQSERRQVSILVPLASGSMPGGKRIPGPASPPGTAGAADIGMSTASARLRPAVPVPAGRRRGRANAGSNSSSR